MRSAPGGYPSGRWRRKWVMDLHRGNLGRPGWRYHLPTRADGVLLVVLGLANDSVCGVLGIALVRCSCGRLPGSSAGTPMVFTVVGVVIALASRVEMLSVVVLMNC